VKCKNCGETVDSRRVDLGYDYCTRRECQERFVERVELARVTVNKAADQYVRAEEVVPSGPRPRWAIDEETDDQEEGADRPRRPAPERPLPRPSTEQRLRRAAARLDAALMQVYESFCRS
jgi:hypothetical protein